MSCIPCAIAVLGADGPSLETLLADARKPDNGYSCDHPETTHGADAPPCPPGACPTCHAVAVTLAADPAFRAVAKSYPNAKMSLCADCRGKSKTRVYGDDYAGETAEDAFMSQGSGSSTTPYTAPSSSSSFPDQSAYYAGPGDSQSSISNAIALAQQAGTAAQYGISLAQQAGLIKGPNGQMVPAASVQPPAPPLTSAAKKKDYTLYIALGAAAALVVLYFVTLPPKTPGQGGAPGALPGQPQFS